jgi:monofunctional glycosyltransferase
VLIESLWPKTRILEVYVNIAEFGDGVYGAQAAARRYFGRDASQLEPAQAARLAAVLPSPRRYSAARPGPYVQRRTAQIQRQMRQIGGEAYLRQLD